MMLEEVRRGARGGGLSFEKNQREISTKIHPHQAGIEGAGG